MRWPKQGAAAAGVGDIGYAVGEDRAGVRARKTIRLGRRRGPVLLCHTRGKRGAVSRPDLCLAPCLTANVSLPRRAPGA